MLLLFQWGRGSLDVPSVCMMEATDGLGTIFDGKKNVVPIWDATSSQYVRRSIGWDAIREAPQFPQENTTKLTKRPHTAKT